MFISRLIVGSGFGLTFWTRTEIGSGCSHFQPDAIRSDWELDQSDPTRQESELDVKRAKYRNFSGFWLLHYLFALSFDREP
jgi:hypothetical protein